MVYLDHMIYLGMTMDRIRGEYVISIPIHVKLFSPIPAFIPAIFISGILHPHIRWGIPDPPHYGRKNHYKITSLKEKKKRLGQDNEYIYDNLRFI